MNVKQNKFLIVTILVAALMISGSVTFLGIQMYNTSSVSVLESEIEKGIEAYVAKQQEEAQKEKEEQARQKQEAEKMKEEKAQEILADNDYSDDDAFLGDENASVTIVEFSDFQCPYCRSFYNDTYPKIKANYVDTGKVKFVYRDFPLNFHKDAIPAAMATECVREQKGDEALFAMHDKIFEGQNELGFGTVKIPRTSLDQYAKELGANMSEFASCMDSEKYKGEVLADLKAGQEVGIDGTPGFVVDGKVIVGAQPYSKFEAAIEAALSK